MFQGGSFFITAAIWGAQLFYLVCFVPQIITNFRLGSANGLSDVLLFGYLNGYLAFFYFMICSGSSPILLFLCALQFFAWLILIFQRFYYDSTSSVYRFFAFFLVNMLVASSFLPIAIKNPMLVGSVSGWIAAVFFCVSQFFQIGKIYITKSVIGFSFLFALFMMVGAALELTVAYVLAYSFQSRLSLWRLVMGCGIYCFQFLMYRK